MSKPIILEIFDDPDGVENHFPMVFTCTDEQHAQRLLTVFDAWLFDVTEHDTYMHYGAAVEVV